MNCHDHHVQPPPVIGAHQNHNHHDRELHPRHLEHLQTQQMRSRGALAEPLGQCELCVHTTKVK